MIKIHRNQIINVFAQPLSRILLVSLAIVALVPLVFMGIKLYQLTWDEAWREITEKHQLLAQNLAAPISLYIEDQKSALEQLGRFVSYAHRDGAITDLGTDQQQAIREAMQGLKGFRSVSVVDLQGNIVLSTRDDVSARTPALFSREQCFLYTRDNDRWFVSAMKPSPFDQQPVVIMSRPLHDAGGLQRAILMAELRIDLIENLRQHIRFGVKGHSAIVDQHGKVVAHPNPEWMKTMRDLSSIPVVQKMMRGETGVTEFYSPFIQSDMVAGYASVPGIRWGIMVPQPRHEVEASVNRILYAQLTWGLVGLALSLLIAWLLARWIAMPMKRMSKAASEMVQNRFEGDLPGISRHAPREVRSLYNSFHALVQGLQFARDELSQANHSLQSRIDEATCELRDANDKLQRVASQDYLTGLYNRRHFELSLDYIVKHATAELPALCLMMLDIDNFKTINDRYGHAAGDHILISMTNILREQAGQHCLLARYAGDEFVALFEDDYRSVRPFADRLLRKISETRFYWQGQPVNVTVSIGLYQQDFAEGFDGTALLHGADDALYQAKEQGRNTVSFKQSA